MGDQKAVVTVAGATGRTGRLIVEELLKRDFQVKALVRSVSSASWLQQEGVQLIEADINSTESLEQALDGAQFVISALGSKKPFNRKEYDQVDNMGNQNLAKAVMKKSVQQMVMISSIGVGDSKYSIGFLSRILLGLALRMKEKSEGFLKTCGVTYTIIRPGGLSNKELSGEIAFGEGGKIVGSVNRTQVAKACVDALTNPAMKNRTFEVVDASTVKEELHPFIINLA